MARLPKDKASSEYDLSQGLYRPIQPFGNISSFDGNFWRQVARSQPVIMDCISTLIMYVQGLPYDIRAREPDQNDNLKDERQKYLDILQNSQDGQGFLTYLDLFLQDYYMTPFGGATETVRYSDGELYSIRSVDAATLYPTQIKAFPVAQYAFDVKPEPIYFSDDELVRMFQSPRPELLMRGWGMPQAEKVYLTVLSLNRGDKYYANLLLDTPEAGILDLGDMASDAAEKWMESFRNLFTGIDGFKIPVLFEHTTPAKYIPFNRPPTEMMFDIITIKYAELACSAFGMTIGDIGLKSANQGGMGGAMRDEKVGKNTGKASVKAHVVEHMNKILPRKFMFTFIDTDDENLTSKGRARSANAIAGRNLIESGAITPALWRAQLRADGLITVPMPEEVDPQEFDIVKDISGLNDQIDLQYAQLDFQKKQAKDQLAVQSAGGSTSSSSGNKGNLDRKGGQGGFSLQKRRNVRGGKTEAVLGKDQKLPSDGGKGEFKSEIVERAVLLDNQLTQILTDTFVGVSNKLTDIRLKRIVKETARKVYPIIKSTIADEQLDSGQWLYGYVKALFDTNSVDETDKFIQKSLSDAVDGLAFGKDKWWEINLDDTTVGELLISLYERGLRNAALDIQEYLYEEGLVDTAEIDDNFELVNEKKRNEFYKRALDLVSLINSGSLYYLKRLAVAAVADALTDPYYKTLVEAGATIESLLDDDSFMNIVSQKLYDSFVDTQNDRILTINDFENNRAENLGRLDQFEKVGLTKKGIVHSSAVPCDNCQENESLGFVDINYLYDTNMGQLLTTPLHPHCQGEMIYDKQEVLEKIPTNYYTGE